MIARLLISAEELARHDAWLSVHSRGSLWQSAAWRRYQEALGRQTRVYAVEQNGDIVAAASVIIDRTAGGFSVWECPRGPVWDVSGQQSAGSALLSAIASDAKKERCIRLFLSPPAAFPWEAANVLASTHGPLTTSRRHVHPRATLVLDISKTDEEILAQMHAKGRYNIRLAEKHGMTVESSSDISEFYALLTGTGVRDEFTIHQESHYTRFLQSLGPSFLFIARHENRPIAGLLGVIWEKTGIYYYGASSYEHRALMAPYALQWAAIRHCKAFGCLHYDLLGIDAPGAPATAWKGITDFKRKFGGTVVTYPIEQELVLRPWAAKTLALKRKIFG